MFLTAAHLVIVWPEMDDPALLRHSAAARDAGRNPKPTVYEPAFGPACSYYQWDAAGNPVCISRLTLAVLPRPPASGAAPAA